jgi:hypothetical protein
MKPRHANHLAPVVVAVVARIGLAAVLLTLSLAACAHPQRRNDWRTPSPPMACGTDADCRGGTCAIELGASKGTCSAPAGSPGSPADAGAPANGPNPGPNVQPSSSDIQI